MLRGFARSKSLANFDKIMKFEQEDPDNLPDKGSANRVDNCTSWMQQSIDSFSTYQAQPPFKSGLGLFCIQDRFFFLGGR